MQPELAPVIANVCRGRVIATAFDSVQHAKTCIDQVQSVTLDWHLCNEGRRRRWLVDGMQYCPLTVEEIIEAMPTAS